MRIVILGAGIVGVTSAFRLMADGHLVTVIDRASGPATETSWGNAGLISTGHAFAWGSLPALKAGIGGLMGHASGFSFEDRRSAAFRHWALRFAAECLPSRERANTQAKHRLCLHSQALWLDTMEQAELQVQHKHEGALYLYRDAAALSRAARMSAIMNGNGQAIAVLGASEALALDPGLQPLAQSPDGSARPLAGALHAASDASGSCHAFAAALCARLRNEGLETMWETSVLGLIEQRGRVTGVWTDKGGVEADAVVLALGPDAAPFLAQHGVRLPVYPVKGYSLHVEGAKGNAGPRIDGVDKHAGIAWRRQGDEIRLTTGAVFAGHDRSIDPAAIARLKTFGNHLFPGNAGAMEAGQSWAGFRPMTPKGLPVVREQQPGLWLNVGHGHMGWTMAHATARILADEMAGREPPMRLLAF
jgi:D-amino-acid dehydrogenase